ncbi:N,N-dimethylformamidase beta subunit family domain-containing protein [Massilia antarctica]|uniref:N,N-dimethylformamidase beta subunit family domain-containing protein n=1 Tax=Massilia antarctica TaxID=2765360 RepID=UPI0035A68773
MGLLARGYRLLLSVGHGEYWSEEARNHIEDFIGSGGNVAFFAANVCWWRIHYVDEGGAIVCHQGGPYGALDHWWPVTGAGRPEDALAGVSYRVLRQGRECMPPQWVSTHARGRFSLQARRIGRRCLLRGTVRLWSASRVTLWST